MSVVEARLVLGAGLPRGRVATARGLVAGETVLPFPHDLGGQTAHATVERVDQVSGRCVGLRVIEELASVVGGVESGDCGGVSSGIAG